MNVQNLLKANRPPLKWGKNGIFAIADQGFFSASNFIFNVLLARWLPEAEYGAFSVSFVVYLFITGFHNAILLEPISVLGTGKYASRLKQYLQAQYKIHFFFTLLLSVLTISITQLLYSLGIISTLLYSAIQGAGVFLPLMLIIWLIRRIYYILGQPQVSFFVSLTYALTLGLAAILFNRWIGFQGHLFFPYLIYGAASLVAFLFLILFQQDNQKQSSAHQCFSTRALLSEQWTFGRWLVLGNILYFIGNQIQFLLVGLMLSLGESGVFRAMQNVMLPMMQIITAISSFSLPNVSRSFGEKKPEKMQHTSFGVMTVLVLLAGSYLAGLFIFPGFVEKILYGGKFQDFLYLIPYLGIPPLLLSFTANFSLINRSLQKPVYHTITTGTVALVGIITAPIMIYLWGIVGAVGSLICIEVFSLALNILLYRKWFGFFGENYSEKI